MLDLSIYNHQDIVDFSTGFLSRFEHAGHAAIPHVLEVAIDSRSVLPHLEEVEVSLIDDETIADIHLRFMDIPGATDVITFDHGEIHISVETARQQAQAYDQTFERELILYMIHGLLHLAGYEDATTPDRLRMDQLQQGILNLVWPS